MPAKSAAQKRLMDAAAHNPAFAKKVGIPSKVAKEFSQASKGQTFKKESQMATKKYAAGGMPDKSNKGGAMRGLERAAAMSGRTMPTISTAGRAPTLPVAAAGRPVGMKSGGYTRAADGVAAKGKTKGKIVKMAAGGLPSQAAARAGEALSSRSALPSQAAGTRPFKKGGKVTKMADGGLPSQAAARAGQALASRSALPTQAVAARPFKKGGRACK